MEQGYAYIQMRMTELPRGKAAILLFNLAGNGPRYAVANSLNGRIYHVAPDLDLPRAETLYQVAADAPGPGGDSGWLAVLDRLQGRAPPAPGEWEGSPAEFASRHTQFATWEWLQLLTKCREIAEQRSAT